MCLWGDKKKEKDKKCVLEKRAGIEYFQKGVKKMGVLCFWVCVYLGSREWENFLCLFEQKNGVERDRVEWKGER